MAYIGTLPLQIIKGGTGQSTLPADGQLLIGNTGAFDMGNLTAGSGISIVNAPGSITIASTTVPPVLTPVFIARKTATASDITGDGTNYTIIFDTADSNVGAAYDTSTGIFTAPDTDDYTFMFCVETADIGLAHTLMDIKIVTGAGKEAHGFYGNPYVSAVSGRVQISQSVAMVIAAADTVHVSFTVSNGAKTVDVVGAATYETWFAGYRLEGLGGGGGGGGTMDGIVDGSGNTVNSSGGYVTFVDGNNVSSLSGSTAHVTFNITGTTDHLVQLGNASGSLTSLNAGLSGQVLISGGAVADPAFGVVSVAAGGTGLATLTDHAVLLGEGTSNVGFAGPAAANLPLVSNGLLSDPAFSVLTVPGGGTGAITLTNYAVLLGQGTSAVSSVGPGASGLPLVGQGASSPIFTALGVPGGGTGSTSLIGIISGNGASPMTASAVSQYTTLVAGASNAVVGIGPGSANYVLTSNGAGANPTFQPISGGGLAWTEVTGTSQAAAVNNGYICNNAALVTVTLPGTAAIGDIVAIGGSGAGLWRLTATAGDTIQFGNQPTSSGGSVTATHRYDAIEVVCITANTTWIVLSSVGNFTIA